MRSPPTEILEHLAYNGETGEFSWRVSRTGRFLSRQPGTLSPQGYRLITFEYRRYMAHRLAWLISYGNWPEQIIDHVNGVRSDNRLLNLRLATSQQNAWNKKPHDGRLKGVEFDARYRRPFVAHIRINGRRTYLGSYSTENEAHAAYRSAALEYFGEFARFD